MITASFPFDPSNRNQWRSAKFDPVLSTEEALGIMDIKSSTRPRAFSLFPQAVAQNLTATAEHFLHIPSNFSPPEQD
jgi:hypothetical protein